MPSFCVPFGVRAEGGDDAPAHRPAERRDGAGGFRLLGHALGFGHLGLGDAGVLRRNAGDALVRGRHAARLRQPGRRRAPRRKPVAAGNGDAVADLDLGIGAHVVGVRQRRERNAAAARNADQAFARRHHVHVLGGARVGRRRRVLTRIGGRRGALARGYIGYVARNDQPLARPQRRAALHAVGLEDREGRHAVRVRDAFQRVAAADGDRAAAVPGPMPGRLGGCVTRRHRTGHVGSVRTRPIGAEAAIAVSDAAAIGGNRRGPARRRQRLRLHAAMHRTLRDRAGIFRTRRTVRGEGIGIEAR